MLEEKDGVIAAYPNGNTQRVEIRASKADVFSKKSVEKLVESDPEFTLKSFEKAVVTKPTPDPEKESEEGERGGKERKKQGTAEKKH